MKSVYYSPCCLTPHKKLTLLLAAFITAINVAKPVVVDDTAYLLFARHIAQSPWDPYGFELFWYDKAEPARDILLPPVLPYWLALGITLFGERIAILKLWLFPYAWLLAWSLHHILKRFASGVESSALLLIVFSPALMATTNLMLDIPAIALGLAAFAVYTNGYNKHTHVRTILAGLLLALAMQTKYTMLVMPGVVLLYGVIQRETLAALITIAFAGLLFLAWEATLGDNHFLHHLAQQHSTSSLRSKWSLVAPLFSFLGLTAGLLAFWAARPLGWPAQLLNTSAALAAVAVIAVVVTPYPDQVLVAGQHPGRDKLTWAVLVWRTLGVGVAMITLSATALLVWRCAPRLHSLRLRRSPDSWFLIGWLLLELMAYFALTPFPAGRRVIGLTIVTGFVLARAVSCLKRLRPGRPPLPWVIPAAIVSGSLFTLLDVYDAQAEPQAIQLVRQLVNERQFQDRVWFAGHWGTQFYGEQAGFIQYVPGPSNTHQLKPAPGDWLILPEYPDPFGFYRPYTGGNPSLYQLQVPTQAEVVARIPIDDALPAMTIPNFYGGTEPIVPRAHPRVVFTVYQLHKPWPDNNLCD